MERLVRVVVNIHPETEMVRAGDLEPGDNIFVRDEWHKVVTNYKHPRSPYAKLSIVPESEEEHYRINRICGLYWKMGLNDKVIRQTRRSKMTVALMNASQFAADLSQKLGDLQALQDAPPRIEVVPSVWVDKDVLLNTLRSDIKVLYSKLGEQIKKV